MGVEMINPGKFDVFLGENVIITIDTQSSITHSSEHGTMTESYPTEFDGILLDYDDENFYLGDLLTGVREAIPQARRISIKLDDGMEVINKVLEQMPDPQTEEDVN